MAADPWLPPSCSLALRPVPKTAHSRTRASDCGPPLSPRLRALHGPRSGGVENGCACGAHISLFSREESDTDRACRTSTPSRQTRTWGSCSGECRHSSSCTGPAPFFIQDATETGVFEALLTRYVSLPRVSSLHRLTPHSQRSTHSSSCTSTFSSPSPSSSSARSPSAPPSPASRSSPRTTTSRRR
jgi:hypothetical protein